MERNPWFKNVSGPFPAWAPNPKGSTGVKKDGGGSIRGCGRVGPMLIHRAVCNRDVDLIRQLTSPESGYSVNEVEAAGNTPLHNAAFEGWEEGVELLIELGAKVNASNNAGDTPWHWASNMGHSGVMELLQKKGASMQRGKVLVQEHVPKVKDFYTKECWSHHPKPYADFIDFKLKEYEEMQAERKKAIRV
eukprot:gene28998-32191_t